MSSKRNRKKTNLSNVARKQTIPSLIETINNSTEISSNLSVISEESLLQSFSFFTAKELVTILSLVCKSFLKSSSLNFLWMPLCNRLWQTKEHVCEVDEEVSLNSASSIIDACKYKRAYYKSIANGKRMFVFENELLGQRFSFRFKEAAGDAWLDSCPWRKGCKAHEVVFERNKNMQILWRKPIIKENNVADNGLYAHEGNDQTTDGFPKVNLVWKLQWTMPRRQRHQAIAKYWRSCNFGREPSNEEIENIVATSGDSFNLHVNGIPVPTYHLRRSPTNNWGFVFESCWALYTSFEMPPLGTVPQLEDDNLSIDVDSQFVEVMRYNKFVAAAAAAQFI